MRTQPYNALADLLYERAVHPGQIVSDSGAYISAYSRQRTTLVRGNVAPPTPWPNERWVQIYDTIPMDWYRR